jgi:hypothetical protein
MSDLAYLQAGLLAGNELRNDLAEPVRALARAWVAEGVDAGHVEILAELLARWAAELGEDAVTVDAIVDSVGFLRLPDPVLELIACAAANPLGTTDLAAVAVHLIDIAESMAIRVFVPELPALSAKSDRTGDAARMVGTARHLKG